MCILYQMCGMGFPMTLNEDGLPNIILKKKTMYETYCN